MKKVMSKNPPGLFVPLRNTFTKSVPGERDSGTREITFATDDIGDTPGSPLLVTATPIAGKKSLL